MHHRGYSLLELLVTLVLAAVLLATGIPAVTGLALDVRRNTDINALVSAIQLARSEAAKRATAVILCRTPNEIVCGNTSTGFEDGWMVFVDTDGDSRPTSGEPVLFIHKPLIRGTIRSNRAAYTFRPHYRRSTNGTITFCDERGETAARAVIVSHTGRPRVSDRRPGDGPLRCAG
jgi:type IV fimbrial biogenesis protein FimT